MWYDGAIGKMGIRHLQCPLSQLSGRLKPDGVAQSARESTCLMLEFTRTSDFWEDSLSIARLRKHDKLGYVELQAELGSCLPGWRVDLCSETGACSMRRPGKPISTDLASL
eukprot:2845869-Rhodomonas_salina.1